MRAWKRLAVVVGMSLAVIGLQNVLAQDKPAGKPEAKQEGAKKEEGKKPEAKADSKRPLCPVMGEPIDFSVKTMTDAGPVYFCCSGCIDKYTKDPAKYAEKVTAQRDALKKLPRVQVSCPISGKPVDGKTKKAIDGHDVMFCCDKCPDAFTKDKDKMGAKLEGCYTYQLKCPVSGEAISGAAFKDLPTGQRVYFCCDKCIDKFMKEPEKYVGKLEEQGVTVNPKKVKG